MPVLELEPVYSAKTERLYAALPAALRADDAEAGYGFKLLLSLIGDRTTNVSELVRRFTYLPGVDLATAELRELLGAGATSDLVDPATADPAWLMWLAQIPGVTLAPGLSEQGRRDAIEGAVNGWAAGTRDSIRDAARTALIGTRYVSVLDHSISTAGDGGRWDVLLITSLSETPDVAAVLAAVSAADAVPVGVLLHHRAYTATWAAVEAAYPTWADRNGLTWATLQEAGL